MDSDSVIETIRARRVTRYFAKKKLNRSDLETVLDAGRWAPSAGNRKTQKFIVIENPRTVRLIRWIAPGIVDHPVALIVICTDWRPNYQIGSGRQSVNAYIDIGTTVENMLLAAQALGLGAGPVTSFSQAALRVLLELPHLLSPDLIVCLGYPAPHVSHLGVRPPKQISWKDLTYWESFETADVSTSPIQNSNSSP